MIDMLFEPISPYFGFGIFVALLGIFFGLATFFLLIWVIYDTLTIQEGMDVIEKLIWIIGSFVIPVIIPIVYYIAVKKKGKYLLGEEGSKILNKEKNYKDLDKLHELKEKGVITEEEYEEKRKELIDKL